MSSIPALPQNLVSQKPKKRSPTKKDNTIYNVPELDFEKELLHLKNLYEYHLVITKFLIGNNNGKGFTKDDLTTVKRKWTEAKIQTNAAVGQLCNVYNAYYLEKFPAKKKNPKVPKVPKVKPPKKTDGVPKKKGKATKKVNGKLSKPDVTTTPLIGENVNVPHVEQKVNVPHVEQKVKEAPRKSTPKVEVIQEDEEVDIENEDVDANYEEEDIADNNEYNEEIEGEED